MLFFLVHNLQIVFLLGKVADYLIAGIKIKEY